MKKSILILIIAMFALSLSACDALRYFALTDPTKNPIEVTAEAEKTKTAAAQTAIIPPVLDEGDMTDPNFTEPTPADPSTIDLSTMDGKIDYTNARLTQFIIDKNIDDVTSSAHSSDGELLVIQVFFDRDSALERKMETFNQDFETNGALSAENQVELDAMIALYREVSAEITETTTTKTTFQFMDLDGKVYFQIDDGVPVSNAYKNQN